VSIVTSKKTNQHWHLRFESDSERRTKYSHTSDTSADSRVPWVPVLRSETLNQHRYLRCRLSKGALTTGTATLKIVGYQCCFTSPMCSCYESLETPNSTDIYGFELTRTENRRNLGGVERSRNAVNTSVFTLPTPTVAQRHRFGTALVSAILACPTASTVIPQTADTSAVSISGGQTTTGHEKLQSALVSTVPTTLRHRKVTTWRGQRDAEML